VREPLRPARSITTPATPAISFGAWVGLCAVLALALRAPFFGTPLGVDEGGLAFVAERWVRHGSAIYGSQWLDRPPLLVLVVRIAVGAAGAAGMRTLGALAALGIVVIVAQLAARLDGPGAGRLAAVVAAVLASSIALQAVYTPAELIAAVPASASVLCLFIALRSGRLDVLFAAGALAGSALLVKQSFLDAGLAGLVFLVACSVCRPAGHRWTWPVAWAAGAVLPLLAVAIASGLGYVNGEALPYALIGFRLDALRTLGGSGVSLTARSAQLAKPALASGLALAVLLALWGLSRLRHDRIVAATLTAWLGGGLAGVAGGGTYWAHYLIEVVPVAAVLAGIAMAAMPATIRATVLSASALLAVGAAIGAIDYVRDDHPHGVERAVGRYIHANARPGDTQYVLYARANVLYYGGVPTPFPYDWSLMLRAHPGVPAALYRLLASPRRPTWLVRWQDDERWHLDRGDIVDRLLRGHYRVAATIDGHSILHRIDSVGPRTRVPGFAAGSNEKSGR
jgi:4-amino-4-deoxy-L-arabinose transferase-like glycosyltransferase